MKILIVTIALDVHAEAVSWGLRQMGHEPIILKWSDFPKSDSSSYFFEEGREPRVQLSINGETHHGPFDVVWNRRRGKPQPMAASHVDDLAVIEAESFAYIRNVSPYFGHDRTLWINPLNSMAGAELKTRQLVVARECDFRIPDTLISNQIFQVREFYTQHAGNIIFKSFLPGQWSNENGSMTVKRTAKITGEMIEDSFPIQACPGIYQANIDKAYELRVTVMGDVVLAAAIYSQQNGETTDWRYDFKDGKLPIRAIELPEDVSSKCKLVCKKLGLAFGCIDLIVSKAGECFFLEINEHGQFLWKEKFAPEIPALDTFCRLLAGGQVAKNIESSHRLRLSDWEASESCKSLELAARRSHPS